MTLKDAQKWLKEQEQVDAPQADAKGLTAMKRQHDGRETHLRDWRDFRGQYFLLRRNVEDEKKGDEQSRLVNLFPDAWVKGVTRKKAKRAKSKHTVKMMLDEGAPQESGELVKCQSGPGAFPYGPVFPRFGSPWGK